ncbi:Transmembrane 9 superfamily member [Caenorhabditis elegans]|uniref:Transmembrane 9 superfamily member n=1 Tax=Caenorhabditis elegans TaxID=6239 RepID=Q7YWP2_CAEEL|nr:Transmembrane 9 superfamily member [Caenorhabditis elegans]CAE18016.2 Transmembrane 9 superfamily member [Caenorhabditis elegans]|eukprot:NP_001024273.2 Uncharacterized protein CELE_Y60A3A.23 [Caenorhabditis elegans]
MYCVLFGFNWANSWSIFFLGFSTGSLLLTLIFTVMFIYFRISMRKCDEFRIRGEVALPPHIIGKYI